MLGKVVLPFADGVYAFRLGFGQVVELQTLTDAGPLEIYRRLLSGEWRFGDVRETIRLALIGGAEGFIGADIGEDGQPEGGIPVRVDALVANKLVRTYVDTFAAPAIDPEDPPEAGQPLAWQASAFLAAQIMAAGLSGVKDEPLGKKKLVTEGTETNLSPTDVGDGLASFQPSQSEGSPG